MHLLRLWPDGTQFDFMRFRHISFPASALLSIATIVVFLTMGLNFGVDFKGGTLMELQAKSAQADVAKVRQTANAFGADYDFSRVETVGPRVSGELVQSGTIGVILSVLAVKLYLWFRFEQELALGAIIGTLHDIVLALGFFVITRHEFNMTSIAAILTIVGYSLNETVVMFDRTRELMRRYKAIPTEELLNLSINSTMSRTVMTATAAFLSLLALVLFGGRAIEGFAQVMLCGVVICTYSAIFISTPVLIYIGLQAGSRAPAKGTALPQ